MSRKTPPVRKPDPIPHRIDIHVGNAVRLRRRALEMSQEALAGAVGLTFQQIQKYERGSNRISSSKLYDIAGALRCDPGALFPAADGAPQQATYHEALIDEARRVDAMAPGLIADMATLDRKLLGSLHVTVRAVARPAQRLLEAAE